VISAGCGVKERCRDSQPSRRQLTSVSVCVSVSFDRHGRVSGRPGSSFPNQPYLADRLPRAGIGQKGRYRITAGKDGERALGAKQNVPPPLTVSHSLSWAATRVHLSRETPSGEPGPMAQASGFFWADRGKLFLITNWHNVTGCNPGTLLPISEMGLTPNILFYEVAIKSPGQNGSFHCRWTQRRVELFDADQRPRWQEHPVHRRLVDVVALEIIPEPNVELFSIPINTWDGFVDFAPSISNDAFILGYPLGLTGGARFPIWKRASIASEPKIELDGLPKLLVDTASRKGMSGSPVIAVNSGWTRPRGVISPSPIADEDVFGRSEAFLGVYSGRVDDDPMGAQIGIVWRADALQEIVFEGVPGKGPFD